jgi:hypothetical protein
VLPPASKTAKIIPKKSHAISCVEIPDADDVYHLENYLSTPNGELLLHIDESLPISSECPTKIFTTTEWTLDKVLDVLSSVDYPMTDICDLLKSWAHESRAPEIDDSESLIHTLLNISQNLASEILIQLKEPRAALRNVDIGHYKDKSLVVQATLRTLDGRLSVADDLALVDCGAGGRGYISSSFVDRHRLPCTPLPYHIPIYNVDGTQNKAGAIKRLCTMNMQIGGHSECIIFRVTDTGSSNIILGLEWLRLHDPLVNWTEGKLFFMNCPAQCTNNSTGLCTGSVLPQPQAPSQHIPDPLLEDLGPDADFARSLFDCNSTDEIIAEWHRTLSQELGPDDDAVLVIDIKNILSLEATKPTDNRITDHLRQTKESSNNIDKYLKDFTPVFSKSGFDDLPPRRSWDHAIELKPTAEIKPISSKVYALSRPEQIELDKFLDEHLKTGRIRPSKSSIASPFFFVKKKDGSLRPVQDYRRLNEITIRNHYPLPLVSELMDKLKGAKYFTKLDVRWGYENIRIKEGDEWKAAFITNRGLFEPTVMFFGLTNSPATFQNMMNDIFRDLLLTGQVIIYMDNILIFTYDLTTHRLLTRQVLTVLQKHNLFLKPEKCTFEALEVEYLGVVISQGQLKMDPKKIEALKTWPTLRSKKDVQQFLGFVNFYRRFVKDFAKIARPLNHLCGSSPWSWSTIENNTFLALRHAVVKGPILAIPSVWKSGPVRSFDPERGGPRPRPVF